MLEDQFPLLRIFVVDIGDDIDMKQKNVYSFVKTLLEEDAEQIQKLFKEYGFKSLKNGGPEKLLPAIEQQALDKGIEIGRKEGKEEGKLEGKIEEKKETFEKLVLYFIDKGMSKKEAEAEARQIVSA